MEARSELPRASHDYGRGEYRRIALDVFGQQDPRGRFSFTGARSGSDFADFLLGLPQTASIAYGNADKFFRSNAHTRRMSPTTGD